MKKKKVELPLVVPIPAPTIEQPVEILVNKTEDEKVPNRLPVKRELIKSLFETVLEDANIKIQDICKENKISVGYFYNIIRNLPKYDIYKQRHNKIQKNDTIKE
jgi:hypothetical protein